MHYPPPPRRPQAYRVRFAPTRRDTCGGARTWHFCVAALVLLACAGAAATSRSAAAAPDSVAATRAAATESGGIAGAGASAVAETSASRTLPALDKPEIAAPAVGRPALDEPHGAAALPPAPPLRRPTAAVGHLGVSHQGRQLRVQVTAYSASVEEGTAGGITRSGTRVRPGVVAVDPAVIPLGSRVRIAGLPGVYRAEDTGGGVRGAHVDVFIASRADALRFGRQRGVLIEVLD